uniref:Uncharacterized protein n=1 Tax=Chromera velia CCMP2878 TaxID=1169474 RepID=A0A0G4GKR6_9ALVE|eukprot:Cvel_22344.t1-p1 / transcript=Cvel_22344.t1 / gene=Cvel_22344 / organism=Chromera_velia_CCMP2878 / gene_product=hypothetical protein / transcript_product=hypothetical protein / location=Cvel_scaffold2187:27376-28626(-) / protein_length=417 / sequence_SO=supercontig / SO=protein_coding / is_pseudo=false
MARRNIKVKTLLHALLASTSNTFEVSQFLRSALSGPSGEVHVAHTGQSARKKMKSAGNLFFTLLLVLSVVLHRCSALSLQTQREVQSLGTTDREVLAETVQSGECTFSADPRLQSMIQELPVVQINAVLALLKVELEIPTVKLNCIALHSASAQIFNINKYNVNINNLSFKTNVDEGGIEGKVEISTKEKEGDHTSLGSLNIQLGWDDREGEKKPTKVAFHNLSNDKGRLFRARLPDSPKLNAISKMFSQMKDDKVKDEFVAGMKTGLKNLAKMVEDFKKQETKLKNGATVKLLSLEESNLSLTPHVVAGELVVTIKALLQSPNFEYKEKGGRTMILDKRYKVDITFTNGRRPDYRADFNLPKEQLTAEEDRVYQEVLDDLFDRTNELMKKIQKKVDDAGYGPLIKVPMPEDLVVIF